MDETKNDMTATEIGNSPPFKAAVRFISPTLQAMILAGVGFIIGYARDTSAKIGVIGTDVDRIKWELPAIKEASKVDKAEMISKIADMKESNAKEMQTFEGRIRSLYDRYENLATSINEIKLEMAKQAKNQFHE